MGDHERSFISKLNVPILFKNSHIFILEKYTLDASLGKEQREENLFRSPGRNLVEIQ